MRSGIDDNDLRGRTSNMQHQDMAPHGLMQAHCRVRSIRAYAALIGTATLSALALHMVRSTTAADPPEPSVQHRSLPIDLQTASIDTSLQPIGL
jgi:hypothetical protein